jgi:HUS1 checkpoint protein
MSKQCVIRLTQNSVYFNIADDTTPMVWTKLDQNHFFVDYLVAGKSEEFNEIYMELNTGMLAKSVTSLKTAARSVKIKLTNKQQPCLTFDIELSSISAESRLCVHDVPVTIIPQKKWSEYNEPNIEQYDVRIFQSQLYLLRQCF